MPAEATCIGSSSADPRVLMKVPLFSLLKVKRSVGLAFDESRF